MLPDVAGKSQNPALMAFWDDAQDLWTVVGVATVPLSRKKVASFAPKLMLFRERRVGEEQSVHSFHTNWARSIPVTRSWRINSE